jgi:hypothetical protein
VLPSFVADAEPPGAPSWKPSTAPLTLPRPTEVTFDASGLITTAIPVDASPMPMFRLPIAVVQAIWPVTSLGCPSMLTLAVPAPAAAVTDPEVADTTDDGLSLPEVLSDFLLEQPTRPATRIAALPTPIVNPRNIGCSFRFARAHREPPLLIDAQVVPIAHGYQSTRLLVR